MPSVVRSQHHGMSMPNHPNHHEHNGVIKFTNCLLVKGNNLVHEDLWISSITGKILNGQEVLYGERLGPDTVVNLGGRILSPGLIDVQLNGAFGFDFSVIPEEGIAAYGKGVARLNTELVATGVTSYLPTLTSQRPEVYQQSNIAQALPFLGPSGSSRDPSLGSESLGAHCEGPFLNPTKNGIHNVSVLQSPRKGASDLVSCYGASNLPISTRHDSPNPHTPRPTIKLITLAPELPGALSAIPTLVANNFIVSMGHSEATYELATRALSAGATMITHLFNAMAPIHHRNPGIFGLLGSPSPSTSPSTHYSSPTPPTPASTAPPPPRSPQPPFFGLIADGIHLHPTTLKIAYSSHPTGLILVTDAMRFAGMPDGTYPWTNDSLITKTGPKLTLEENGRIAGSSASLVDCVNNFLEWTGVGVAEALRAVTEAPARMLGVWGVKGCLEEGADADLVVFEVDGGDGCGDGHGHGQGNRLVVEQVWKFGRKVFG